MAGYYYHVCHWDEKFQLYLVLFWLKAFISIDTNGVTRHAWLIPACVMIYSRVYKKSIEHGGEETTRTIATS